MNKETFILVAIALYLVSLIIIIGVLNMINKYVRNKYKKEITELEHDKNTVISETILTELNKVEALAKNDDLKEKYNGWQKKFKEIKEKDMPNITDEINDIDELYANKEYDKLKVVLLNAELDLNALKTKADFLLSEIKEITLSEERNRETITKLKADYREIVTTYHDDEAAYEIIKKPIELQFENVDKLFQAFETAMEQNAYTEVGKIVKAIDDIIANLSVVIKETKPIVTLGKNLIPKRIEEIMQLEKKMTSEGYNLEYLNINYNKDEAEKKIQDVFQRLNVLNLEDSLFELRTIYDYFDSLFSDFDKEKLARKTFEDYTRSILLKSSRLEKINNELLKKIDDIKYSYDLTDDDINVIYEIKDEVSDIRASYDRMIDAHRNNVMPYSRLEKEMELINKKLLTTEEKLNVALKTLGSLKEDENRAREQLCEIKQILVDTKEKARSYKLPIIPKNYYVELSEAMEAINNMSNELDQRPISIKTLNTRVDTARDLALKVYNTINETVKTAKMAETAIVYGNRYRVLNKDVDFGLTKAENAFYRGNFKSSLENAISAINIVEPGIHTRLLEEYK
jgi:septation ring formation regulator